MNHWLDILWNISTISTKKKKKQKRHTTNSSSYTTRVSSYQKCKMLYLCILYIENVKLDLFYTTTVGLWAFLDIIYI